MQQLLQLFCCLFLDLINKKKAPNKIGANYREISEWVWLTIWGKHKPDPINSAIKINYIETLTQSSDFIASSMLSSELTTSLICEIGSLR